MPTTARKGRDKTSAAHRGAQIVAARPVVLAAAADEHAADWQPTRARPAAPRARGGQRHADRRGPRAAGLGRVPRDRARHGAPRPGARRGDRRWHPRSSTPSSRDAAGPGAQQRRHLLATFPLVGGLLMEVLARRPTRDRENALGFAAVVLVMFMVTNVLNFAMVAVSARSAARSRSARRCARSSSRSCRRSSPPACSPPASRSATGGSGVGAVGLAAVVLFVFQYLAAAERPGVRARRGARAAHPRARLAAGRAC